MNFDSILDIEVGVVECGDIAQGSQHYCRTVTSNNWESEGSEEDIAVFAPAAISDPENGRCCSGGSERLAEVTCVTLENSIA